MNRSLSSRMLCIGVALAVGGFFLFFFTLGAAYSGSKLAYFLVQASILGFVSGLSLLVVGIVVALMERFR